MGLGIWLLVAPRGRWSRLAGAASVGWGLVVWAFGESFGGIFAPGLTWLFGAPGAVLLYCVAGALVALPERAWATPRLGRIVLGAGGAFLLGMALLQAWPGRGYWQGRGGTLSAMVPSMSQTPQPGFLSSWVTSFGSFDTAHGWAVNLFVVVTLATIGVLFLTGRRRPVLVGVGRPWSSSAWPTGCSSRTSASSAAWAPTPTPWSPWPCCSSAATVALVRVPARPVASAARRGRRRRAGAAE